MNQQFSIFPLTPELISKYNNAPSKPHRHDYEEVIILFKGHPTHFIDFNKEEVNAPLVIYVAQGKIHQFIPDMQTEGWVIRYKNELVPQSYFHFYSNFSDNINYPLPPDECMIQLGKLCEMLSYEASQSQVDMAVVKHLLSALLAKLETQNRKQLQQETSHVNSQFVSFNQFLKILEDNYKRPEPVEFYADKLNMSVRNLNLVCQHIFNKSVSEIVETRKLIEARQLLMNSHLSVSEIGYELGYNEKAYFTRVFTKKTGLTPTAFRSQMTALLT